jgi:hypothetical protein
VRLLRRRVTPDRYHPRRTSPCVPPCADGVRDP